MMFFHRIRAIYHIIISDNYMLITDFLNVGHIRSDEDTMEYYTDQTRKALNHLENRQ